MKILLINGSPKGKASNSLRLANSFIEGVKAEAEKKEEVTVDELHLSSMKIGPCRGCFACWKATPGKCCIKDDMQSVIEKEINADLIVWSFPLYYFNVPGLLKNLIDRQLPMSLPFMSTREDGYGSGSHDARYDTSATKHVLVSTCGFYSAKDNYDSVTKMFDHFVGKGNYTSIFCGQGELFRVKELSSRTDEYLGFVKNAGSEFVNGGISAATNEKLQTLLYPKDVFEKMADASWGVSRETGEKDSEDFSFTKQMAALYNKNAYDGKVRVLEMNYTDLGTSYKILLEKDGCRVFAASSEAEKDAAEKLSSAVTTTINTPFEVWVAISRGEMEGAEALGKQLYTVTGDFSLMMNWNKFFESVATGADGTESGSANGSGCADGSQNASGSLKKPSMTTMLIPWITFWIAVAINPVIGSLITLGVVAALPLIMGKCRFVIWDRLSMIAVAGLSVFANISASGDLPTNLGYLLFGLLWLGSCIVKEPLCSTYVKYDYGAEKALRNPLFMKTNYILATAWGILYILTAIWTFFFRRQGLGNSLIIINNIIPLLMGLFTIWFQKWYPAWKARGH